MTTANLSVGIDTGPAKLALAELKRHLAETGGTLALVVDSTSLDQQIERHFKQRTFKFMLDRSSFKALRDEVENETSVALHNAFKKNYQLTWKSGQFRDGLVANVNSVFQQDRVLRFDRAGLIRAVSTALDEAFAGARTLAANVRVAAAPVPVPAPAPVPGTAGSDRALVETIRLALNPAVEELAKAATAVGGTARKIGARSETVEPTSKTTRSISGRLGDQSTVRQSQQLGDQGSDALAAALMLPNRQMFDAELKRQALEQARFNAGMEKIFQDSANATLKIRERLRKRATEEERYAASFGPTREMFDAELKRQAAEQQKFNAGMARIMQQSSNETLKIRERLRKRATEEERYAASFGPTREMFDAELKRQAAEQARFDRGVQQMLQKSANDTLAIRNRLRRQQEQQEKVQLGSRYNQFKAEAAPNFDSEGAKILAARRLVAETGNEGLVRRFLGPRQYLLDFNGDLDAMHGKVKKAEAGVNAAARSHLGFAAALREAHAGARGLAGSMGAMWLTWGSTAPLVAGAAIGATMRSVLTAGKELEYQLKFVQVLTGGTVVELSRFNEALIGTATRPVEAANALRALAQNGLDAKQAMEALPTILRLATVGEMELSDAALGATGVMAAFNLQVNDLGRVSDVFAFAASESNTSVASMVESMRQASTVGDQYKVTIEETAASLATMAKRNIVGSAAGTAFRNMMTELAAPTDKAKKAMDALGLKIYDANQQLKPFPQLMRELKTVTDSLNEKSKLVFLNELFDERGAKAANSILSDFGLFEETLKRLQTESKGFSKSVSDALGETTQVKIKRLLSEFEQSTTAAFFNSSNSVKNFVDELRFMVKDESFKKGVEEMFAGFVNFGRFLTENVKALALMVGGMLALKMALSGIVGVMSAFGVVVGATTGGMLALGGALTGGLGIIAAIAIAYLTLGKRTDEVAAAAKNHLNLVREQNGAFEVEIKNSKERLGSLQKEREEILATTEALKRMREEREKEKQANKLKESTDLDLQIAQVQDRIALMRNNNGPTDAAGMINAAVPERSLREEESLLNDLLARRVEMKRRYQLQEEQDSLNSLKTQEADRNRVLRGIIEFNSQVEKLTKEGALSKKVNKIDLDAYLRARAPTDRLQRTLKESETELNKAKRNYEAPDPKKAALERKDALADINEMEAQYKRELERLDAYYGARDAIIKAREQARLISQEEAQSRLEESARDHLDERLRLEREMLPKIEEFARKNPSLEEPDRKRLDTRLDDARSKARKLATELETDVQKAAIKVEGRINEITTKLSDAKIEGALRDLKALRDMAKTSGEFELGLFSKPGPAASRAIYPQAEINSADTSGLSAESRAALAAEREAQRRENFENRLRKSDFQPLRSKGAEDESVKAAMTAYDEWQAQIVSATKEVAKVEAELARLAADREAVMARFASADETQLPNLLKELDRIQAAAANTQREVAAAQGALSELEGRQRQSAEIRGQAARETYERQRTAEYGMMSFWKQYQEQAGDTARVVNDIMNQSFSSMERGLMQFVTTGKLNFKEFVRSILADAARMMASQYIRQMLTLAGNAIINAYGSGSNLSTSPGAVGTSPSTVGMTVNREVRPEDYLGTSPGAYQPSTPAGATATSQGGNSIQTTIIFQDGGKVETKTKSSDSKEAREMARQIEQVVLEVISRQKRPGGILEKAA